MAVEPVAAGIVAPNQREVWVSQLMMPAMMLVLDTCTLATLNEIEVGGMPADLQPERQPGMGGG